MPPTPQSPSSGTFSYPVRECLLTLSIGRAAPPIPLSPAGVDHVAQDEGSDDGHNVPSADAPRSPVIDTPASPVLSAPPPPPRREDPPRLDTKDSTFSVSSEKERVVFRLRSQ